MEICGLAIDSARYCECFAAGLYCVDCSCHGCFNKPEFEETVLGTRQQIETRNPLAFAPKVVRASDTSPTVGEDYIDTPASARHKRGCNCKKSQCLKKYCECYQAGVGCADGCRCDGCKNIYGKKEGSEDVQDKEHQISVLEKESNYDQASPLGLINESGHQEEQQNRDLSPITPSLDHSWECRSTLELRSSSGRGYQSEEPLSQLFPIPTPIPFRSPSSLLMSLTGEESTGLANTYCQQAAKVAKVGQFSPRWDGLGDICILTPLPQTLLQSTFFLDRIKPCSSPQPSNGHSTSCNDLESSDLTYKEVPSLSPIQHSAPPFLPSTTYHIQRPENSLTTPVTPIPCSSIHVSRGECQLGELPGTLPHQPVWLSDEDDTPNFSKGPGALCHPSIILKTRSPKQKRVSPRVTRSTNLTDMSSPYSRTGPKSIMQAMGLFPTSAPDLPSINAKGAGDYLNHPFTSDFA